MKAKKSKIKKHVKDMLKISFKEMNSKIDKAIDCGALDIEKWSEDNAPMIIPKTIVAALMEDEARQYYGVGTIHEKRIKKEIKKIKYHL